MNVRSFPGARKLCLWAACLAVAGTAASAAEPALSTRKYFYVGGKYTGPPGKEVMAGHMYVEELRPQRVTQRYPMVLFHGGSELGTIWMSTPDHVGWADYFLGQGYVVYLVDGPARGRSPWHASTNGPIGMRVTAADGGRMLGTELVGDTERSKKHTQWPGEGEQRYRPGNPIFDNFYAGLVPQLDSILEIETLTQAAGVALLDKIGPAIVVTHSQSGLFGWLLADQRPKAVKGIIGVEPNGPPFQAGAYLGNGRVWGLTDIPLTYDPPAKTAVDLAPVREAAADRPDLSPCWMQPNPPRQLTNLKGAAVLIVSSESSPHAAYDHCTSKFLTQAGVKNTYLRLEEQGIKGNGHHMMLEKNNLDIAALLHKWISSNVK